MEGADGGGKDAAESSGGKKSMISLDKLTLPCAGLILW